jgi:hypothetical protein
MRRSSHAPARVGFTQGPSRRRGAILALLVAGAASGPGCGSRGGGAPQPTAIVPDRGSLAAAVPVRIRGTAFRARVSADFAGAATGGVDSGYHALLGTVALRDVALEPGGELAATVPAGLPAGSYDLTVIDPWGASGTLPRAYRVLYPGDSASLVAGYRVDAIGPQQAFRPFTVTIAAVDADGAVVSDFNGSVQLSDATGTSVPGAAARFAGGRWTGLVEVRAPHAADVLTVRDTGGLQASSSPFAVAAPPAVAARVTTAPASASAGACAGPVTIAVEDAFGLPAGPELPTTLAVIAAPAGGFQLFGDAACAAALGAPSVAAGQPSTTVWYRATAAGPLEVTASGPGLAASTHRATITPGPPAALAFVTPPQAVNAGACSQRATVELRDALGNPSPAPAPVAVSLQGSPAGALAFASDGACKVASPAVTIAAGATRAELSFSGTLPQVVAVTASASGLAPATQEVTVTPEGTASRVVFLTPPRAAAAAACSDEVTIQAQDSLGNAVTSPGALQVSLAASPAAGFVTYADAACTTPAATIQLPAGRSTGGFRFRGTAAGTVTVTASSPSLTGATQAQTIAPAAPARVAFASGPRGAPAGTCSPAVRLQISDPQGNASPVAAPLAVTLGAAPADGFALYADPACASPATGVTVPAGSSAASFHFKGSVAGPVVVSATPGGGLSGASQVEQVRAGVAARLAFTSAAQRLAAGACSAAASLEVRDASGNVATAPGGAMVSLAAAPGGGFTFFRDPGCAIPTSSVSVPAGGSAATFHFSGTAAGAVAVTASAPGLDPASQTEGVDAALPIQLAFASGAQTVAAGACSGPALVVARDASGNPTVASATAPTTVALSSSASGVTLFAGQGCSGAAVSGLTIAAGATSATFSFRSSTAGPVPVTAASPVLGSTTQVETVTALAPERLAFATSPRTGEVGACSSPVTVRAEDGYGNPSTVAGRTAVTLSAAPAAGFGFYSDAACSTAVTSVTVPAGGGAATFYFEASSAGSVTVSATAAGLQAAAQTEDVVGAAADRLVFTSPAQRVAAGACSAPVALQVAGASGNATPVRAALPIALSASPATGVSVFAGAGCAGAPVSSITIDAGAIAGTLSFRATASGTVTLAASAAGLAAATQAEAIAPGPVDHLSWSDIPSPQAEAIPFPVTLTARDAWGNVAAEFVGTAAVSASAGAASCSSSCSSATTTGRFMAGVWTGSVAMSPQGAGLTLAAAAGAATATSSPFDVTGAAPRSPPTARLTVSPTVLISGATVTYDASRSTDLQTARASLTFSWDLEATGASMDTAPVPPASPWSPWSAASTTTHPLVNNGGAPVVYRPRVAVRDTEPGTGGPDVGYASATVVVLPNGNGHCVVDTSSDADDGATDCYSKGADGHLSLREALRIANGAAAPVAISFSGPMTIAVTGTLTVSKPVFLVARPGVTLDGGGLSITGTGVLVAGLDLSRQATPVVVAAGAEATFRDVDLHDGAGLVVRGQARLDGVRVSGCTGTCIEVNDPGAWLALFNSELRGTSGNTGLALTSCASSAWSASVPSSPELALNGSVLVAGNVFAEFGTAVDSSCAAAVLTSNTFVRNGTGVRGVGAALLDSIFSGQTAAAVTAATCPGFASSRRHLVWRNASDGCLASELAGAPAPAATFSADPLYVHPASRDYRLQVGSPAKDMGTGTSNVDLDGPAPGRFRGADADRGGRETY